MFFHYQCVSIWSNEFPNKCSYISVTRWCCFMSFDAKAVVSVYLKRGHWAEIGSSGPCHENWTVYKIVEAMLPQHIFDLTILINKVFLSHLFDLVFFFYCQSPQKDIFQANVCVCVRESLFTCRITFVRIGFDDNCDHQKHDEKRAI